MSLGRENKWKNRENGPKLGPKLPGGQFKGLISRRVSRAWAIRSLVYCHELHTAIFLPPAIFYLTGPPYISLLSRVFLDKEPPRQVRSQWRQRYQHREVHRLNGIPGTQTLFVSFDPQNTYTGNTYLPYTRLGVGSKRVMRNSALGIGNREEEMGTRWNSFG